MAKGYTMSGKGDKRRPGNPEKFNQNWDRIFGEASKPIECPACKEITLRPMGDTLNIHECSNCNLEVQML